MSLIRDLLSKVKRQEPRRDVPPLLRDTVMQAAAERKTRSRLMIPLSIAALAAAVGVGIIFLLDYVYQPASVSQPPAATIAAAPPAPPAATSHVQQPERAVAAVGPKVDEKQPLQVEAHKQKKTRAAPTAHRKAVRRSPVETSVKAGSAGKLDEARQEKASGMAKADQAEKNEATRRDRDLYLYAARTCEMQKNYQGAVSNYRKVLAMDPDNYIVMNNLSGALIQTGAYDEAIRYAQQALQIRKDYLFSLINLGVAYSRMSNYEEGERYLRRALSADPANRLTLLNLGLLLEKRNDPDRASEAFARLSDTGDAQGYLGLARIADRQGKAADAIRLYQTVMSMESRESPLWAAATDRLRQLSR